MQVVCSNCQLSFQAPDGATGLVCPICRSPLRGADAPAEPESGPVRQVVDWAGGTLDDLVALISAPAWSARIEVLPATGDAIAGEVHVIAGGVSEAIHEGKSTHDALDKLRAVKGARFRIEPRLPNPSDGDLTFPGPDQGKLEERPLATLMRYCEDYVLTAGIEVWRGSENAKVEYRRGEIVGVTVGGIDAPERLAEVMKWSSGSYRLIAPKLTLPETAPKAPVPAAIVANRSGGTASKTIFGMPALDPAAIAAASEKVKQAQAQARESLQPKSPGNTPSTARPSSPAVPVVAAKAPGATVPPVAAAAPAPATPGQSAGSRSGPAANKTIFGLQAPPAAATAAPTATAAPAATPTAPVATTAPAAAAPTATAPVAVPAQTTSAPEAPAAQPAAAARPATPAAEAPKSSRPSSAPARAAASTELDRPAATKVATKGKPSETPVWTYVGVGFVFGLLLLGVYRLAMVLAH